MSNVPAVPDDATADVNMFLILGALRGFNTSMLALRAGQWRGNPAPPLGHDPEGKTLGILGMGGIGRNLKKKAEAFGMRVIYHNRRKLSEEQSGGAEYVSFDDLLATSDILSLNLPLNVSSHPLPRFPRLLLCTHLRLFGPFLSWIVLFALHSRFSLARFLPLLARLPFSAISPTSGKLWENDIRAFSPCSTRPSIVPLSSLGLVPEIFHHNRHFHHITFPGHPRNVQSTQSLTHIPSQPVSITHTQPQEEIASSLLFPSSWDKQVAGHLRIYPPLPLLPFPNIHGTQIPEKRGRSVRGPLFPPSR